ncbi:MAG: peptidase M16 [Chloroflexi bacterium HGW-Chloroflexi-8]|nr:MAG: peptidase M16 [Chloroflexi bacterium HGW-Chloroflexi-8]
MNKISGFEISKKEFIKEINGQATHYRHIKTGAEILSIENDDENKVFGITFRTPPPDSSGITHIMEHSVLCGSRKYPVKEPFVELMKGSLNTFLNAFTYPDKTCYPVASTNVKDFYNLVDVYLDSVFYPILSPYTLMQEGWHFEIDNQDSEMVYKGVVFNEMKGANSSPDDIIGDESQMSLFPDTPYGFQSGGDPEFIPNLTYQNFIDYHKKYYHPSNARIFFYGDDEPKERLKLLEEYLDDFEKVDVPSLIPLQNKFQNPQKKTIPYESNEDGSDSGYFITLNWLLPEGNDIDLSLGLSILAHILLATPASPLRKAMTESGLGEDIIDRGLENELRQLMFSTGFRSVKRENLDQAEALILETLNNISINGIDRKTIEASLNTIEFGLRENNTGSFPRGLLVMLRSLTSWLYDRDPLSPLAFQKPLDKIKNRFKNEEKYFEKLITDYLVNNNHRVTVILEPDTNLAKLRVEKEKSRILDARNKMSDKDISEIISNSKALILRQETPDSPESLATIPMLSLDDIDRKVKTIPNTVIDSKRGRFLYHDIFTSNILYIDLGFDLKGLTPEQLPFMRLFSRSLLEMGTQKEDFVSLIQHIGRETGGINHSIYTSDQLTTKEAFAYLFIRAKAMNTQVKSLFTILEDILLSPKFDDKERFRQILLEEKSSMEAGLIPSGHRVINNRLKSHFSESAWATEQISGLDYLFFVRTLIQEFDDRWESIKDQFEKIRKILFNSNNLVINATIDKENWRMIKPIIDDFLLKLPTNGKVSQKWTKNNDLFNEGLTIPSQVNYVGKGANIYALGYKYHGSINVISSYLKSTWLWEKVRVLGGAYGGFSTFDRLSGIFTFLSYRDPNLLSTLDYYDRTANFLKTIKIDQAELTKNIIGAIGDIDSYQLPDAKGFTAMIRFLLQISDEERQIIRDQILETNLAHFVEFAKFLTKLKKNGLVVVLGSAPAIDGANMKNKNFLKEIKVL